jgi:hypothetical protein
MGQPVIDPRHPESSSANANALWFPSRRRHPARYPAGSQPIDPHGHTSATTLSDQTAGIRITSIRDSASIF